MKITTAKKRIPKIDLSVFFSKFRTIEPKLFEYPIVGIDTEDDSKGTPLLFGMYGDIPEKSYHTKHSSELLSKIYDIKEKTIFVCHNLEYDITNIFKNEGYDVIDKMIYASGLLKVELYGTKHYFLNSTSFFAGKLADMAKFVGLEKYDGHALDIDYMLQDCKIVYTFVKMLQKKLVLEEGCNLGVTIGRMSMDSYRHKHMIGTEQLTYNSPNCLKAYYGGRVEIFKMGETKNLKVVDINSCYPFVMREFQYPDTSTIEPSTINTHHFGIGEFTVFVPDDVFIPVLPIKADGKLFFPKGKFRGWWTYAEVRHAVEHGARIIKEHAGEGTNSGCRPFESFIDTYYELRQGAKKRSAKNEHDVQAKFDDLFYKLWLNNLYGKWCQHKAGSEMTRDKWPFWKLQKYIDHPKFKTSKIGPFYSYETPEEKPPITANYMWGVYVTSYSRIYLHKGLSSVHKAGHTLVYCDTDSIMYNPCNTRVPFNITSNLGDWDIEHFDLGIFRQAKAYLLCNKTGTEKKGKKTLDVYEIKKLACKGVPTRYGYDFIIEGFASVWKPMRMKEALIRLNAEVNRGKDPFLEEIGENFWRENEKYMKSVYIKRKGKDITYPVDYDEIKDLESLSKTGKLSINKELINHGIVIKKKKHKNNFENTTIPDGWFNRKGTESRRPEIFLSQKIFGLRKEQCIGQKKGWLWFAGDILQVRTDKKNRQNYTIFITDYKGRKVNAHFWGSIPFAFFTRYGISDDLLGKKVCIRLGNEYIDKGLPDIDFSVTESKNKGKVDTGLIEPEGKLTNKQLESLLKFKRRIKK